jgi:hypothetical protein
MKLTHSKIYLALAAVLAGGVGVFAQSNGVPDGTDYAKFSQFVTDRNIFDPARVPRFTSSGTRRTTYRRTTRVNNLAPALTLVGTMSYEKGMFAFFNGNNSDLKKALQVGDKIAGYTVVDISANVVKLETADKKKQFEMKVGDAMRQENGRWVFAGADDLPAETGPAATTETMGSPGRQNATPATPASANQPNEVLKRLMELREKENQ